MSLLKLSSKKTKFSPEQKALEVLNSIPSKSLIIEAYLFGSAISGTFTVDSDLDLLVVVKDETHLKKIQSEVYAARFTDIAIDWILKLETDFQFRKNFGGVCFEAFNYGKKLL